MSEPRNRLERLLKDLGIPNEVAPVEVKAFGSRAGDVIVRAVKESCSARIALSDAQLRPQSERRPPSYQLA
jgi:hypothetical protein